MSPRLLRLLAPFLSFLGLTGAAAPGCSSQSAAQVQGPAPVHTTRPDEAGLRGSLLWEVEGKGRPSYLFGTIHAGYRASELPPWVWDRLASCREFVMEADIDSIVPTEVASRATLPAGQSLEQMLGEKDFDELVDEVGLPAQAVARLRPWAVYSAVVQRIYPTPEPLDQALRHRAQSLGKPLVFLEDWRFQLDTLSRSIDLDDLRELLDPTGEPRHQLDAMIEAYRAGDFETVSAIALDPKEMAHHPGRHARLFDDRNRAWVDKLGPQLDRGGVFVAVGAGHFAGDHGLIELLRARGYIMTRRVHP
jgi:uncharacterized protein